MVKRIYNVGTDSTGENEGKQVVLFPEFLCIREKWNTRGFANGSIPFRHCLATSFSRFARQECLLWAHGFVW